MMRRPILVFVGECDNGVPFVRNEAYDLKTKGWSSLAPMPSGRHRINVAIDGQPCTFRVAHRSAPPRHPTR